MNSFLQRILQAGVLDTYPKYLKDKLYITNALALGIAVCIVTPYIGITYIFLKPLTIIPVICAFLLLSVIVLNHYKMINLSRFIFGLLPVSLPLTYFGFLMPPGSPKYLELYVITIAFSMVPFLVFAARERIYVIVSSIIILTVFVFGLDWINANLTMDIDGEIMYTGFFGKLNLFMGMFLIMAGVYLLSFMNMKSNNRTLALMEEMDKKTEEIQNSENELKEKISQIELNQAEERKRNWATEGIAEISTILRSDQSGHELYDHITSYITKYLNANQCGLFTVVKDEHDDSDVRLVLQSSYAYDRKKFVEKEISPGQGQIGQAYLEKTTIYLKDVPDGYVNITSGMGEHTASEVLIVPLVVNEEVEGVIEFASFNHFEDYHIQFVEQLGETLASFISINRINERTKYLLEESQQQTEEMRAQEEEMRQNMEELSATQEEMGRKEQEYVNLIQELKEENEQLKKAIA